MRGSLGWFFHAHSAMEWVCRLVFRVRRNTFKNEELNRRLGLPTLNDTPGVEIYSSEPRVHVANRKGPWQEVWLLVHRLSEIDTPAFHDFLTQAVKSFQETQQRMHTRPEDVMPWKVNGQRWHLSEKGFPPGRQVKWDRTLLPRLLDLVREVEPELEITWDNRAAITLRLPGVKRAWSQWRTKDAFALGCRFLGKRGQFNLGQIEQFGTGPEILPHAAGEILSLNWQHADHLHAVELKELLREHLQGFRDQFGK